VEKALQLRSGALESLKDRASGFAGMVAAFCQRLGLWQFELLISRFQVGPIRPKSASAPAAAVPGVEGGRVQPAGDMPSL